MKKLIVEIERIRSGQPKDYADSVDEVIFTFSVSGPYGIWTPERETVIAYMRAVCGYNFRANPHEEDSPIAYLETLEQLAANKWRAVVVWPFTD